MLVSLVVAGLFLWSIWSREVPSSPLYVPVAPGLLAAATFAVTISSYFTAPRHKLRQSLLISYIFLTASVWLLAYTTSAGAPQLALLASIMTLGPLLGAQGSIIALLAAATFAAQRFLIDTISVESLILLCASLLTPIAATSLLWLRNHRATEDDRSYKELTTQLNQVSGTADVVINAIGDGVVAVDNKGIITLINPAAQELIGWGNQDAIGLSYKSVIKLLDQQNSAISDSADIVRRVLDSNNPVQTDDYQIRTQSDKSFMANISVKPVGKSGDGAIIVFRDITSQRSDERQRAEFISTASHEMRTPVASIEGYLGLALNPQTATVDDRARSYVTKAQQSAQHLGRLFQDLLDISKADDHRLSNNPSVVNITEFIKDIVDGLAPKAQDKGLSVIYRPDEHTAMSKGSKGVQSRKINPIYYANVDNDHLREIVQNLIENAIKYTPAGSITVDITGDDDQVTISVADTGIGIPREDIGHLFQKFYRVDSSDTREIGGTGLGLYLCRRLAETIGGRLWVESEYRHGSTFYLSVPRVDHMEADHLANPDTTLSDSLLDLAIPTELSVEPEGQEVNPEPPTPAAAPAKLDQPPTSSQPRGFTNTPITTIEAAPATYAEQLRNEIRLNVPPRRK